MTTRNELYLKVLDISSDYLGPASERFVTRQIENHLNKHPNQLRKGDMKKLIDWVRLAMSTLTEDKKLKNEYIRRLERLANDHGQK